MVNKMKRNLETKKQAEKMIKEVIKYVDYGAASDQDCDAILYELACTLIICGLIDDVYNMDNVTYIMTRINETILNSYIGYFKNPNSLNYEDLKDDSTTTN